VEDVLRIGLRLRQQIDSGESAPGRPNGIYLKLNDQRVLVEMPSFKGIIAT
jgi:hypothetical protein